MTNHLETMFLDFESKAVDPEVTEEERAELYGAFVAGIHCLYAELIERTAGGDGASLLSELDAELDAFTERLRTAGECYPPAPARTVTTVRMR